MLCSQEYVVNVAVIYLIYPLTFTKNFLIKAIQKQQKISDKQKYEKAFKPRT